MSKTNRQRALVFCERGCLLPLGGGDGKTRHSQHRSARPQGTVATLVLYGPEPETECRMIPDIEIWRAANLMLSDMATGQVSKALTAPMS
jgi:hypothetical protein